MNIKYVNYAESQKNRIQQVFGVWYLVFGNQYINIDQVVADDRRGWLPVI